jgi:tight adherence protein C
MALALLLGLVLVGVAFVLIGRAVASARVRTAQNVAGIAQYGFAGAVAPADDAATRGALDDLASFVGEAVGGRLGTLRESDLRQQLVSAGIYRVSARMLLGYEILAASASALLWLWISVTGGMNGVVVVLGTLVSAAFGWVAPLTVVRRRAKRRLADIDYALPELIDLIVVSVEAGVGFSGSLRLASDRIPGALGSELRLANQEQRMGLSTTEALENMLARCPTDTMRSFVRSVVQGERLGVSMGQIMRNLAVEMRKRRRGIAEERAHKAPIKMLFPLVFMIFPAMFVVLLGPAVFSIIDALGNR